MTNYIFFIHTLCFHTLVFIEGSSINDYFDSIIIII